MRQAVRRIFYAIKQSTKYFSIFDILGKEPYLQQNSSVPQHEAAAVFVSGTYSSKWSLYKESGRFRWRQLQKPFTTSCRFSTVRTIKGKRFGERTVEKDPQRTGDSSSQ